MIEPAVAKRIRLIGIDVDGTMTDGGIYMGAAADGTPVELKRYEIQDGLGVHLLRRAGLLVALVTGRDPRIAKVRADDLEVDEFAGDPGARKVPLFEAMLQRRGVSWEETAFVGDDLPDLSLLQRVGLPVAVANAAEPVRRLAAYTTSRRGGDGAIREFAEALLEARGQLGDVVNGYLRDRGADGCA